MKRLSTNNAGFARALKVVALYAHHVRSARHSRSLFCLDTFLCRTCSKMTSNDNVDENCNDNFAIFFRNIHVGAESRYQPPVLKTLESKQKSVF